MSRARHFLRNFHILHCYHDVILVWNWHEKFRIQRQIFSVLHCCWPCNIISCFVHVPSAQKNAPPMIVTSAQINAPPMIFPKKWMHVGKNHHGISSEVRLMNFTTFHSCIEHVIWGWHLMSFCCDITPCLYSWGKTWKVTHSWWNLQLQDKIMLI